MSTRIDVAAGVKAINRHIQEKDFRPRDADGSDFQYGTDPGLRFKTGCVMGEVTVTVWRYNRQIDVIRILSEAQIPDAKHKIDRLIEDFFSARNPMLPGPLS